MEKKEKKENKVSGYQIIKFCQSFDKLKDSGVSLKGLKMIDLALNHASMEPIYRAYQKLGDPPEKYIEFQRKLNELKLSHQIKLKPGMPFVSGITIADGEIFVKEARTLEVEYKSVIDTYEASIANQNKMLEEEFSLNLVYLSRDDFIIDEKNSNVPGIISSFSFLIREV